MTGRLQRRIMATFVILLLSFVSIFIYDRIVNAVDMAPEANSYVKNVTYSKSDRFAILEVRWKKEPRSSSAKDPRNYYIEHVIPVKGKWMTAVNGRVCKISSIQHVPDARDPEKKAKVTQISVKIEPKEAVDDFYRVRVRDISDKEGQKMGGVEFGVAKVSSFANFTKK
jgi:hypothetical protein